MTPEQALSKAHKAAGTIAQLARWAKCSRQAASSWQKIPAEHVLRLEKVPEIGLTRYQMRSDIYGTGP